MPKILPILLLSIFTGLSSGILSTLFLHGLGFVTELRHLHKELIWGLPFFGLLLGWIKSHIPQEVSQGVPYLLHAESNENFPLSVWTVPHIFLASLGTHLFGGSAGREGVGIIMGAGISQILPSIHERFSSMRKYLIYAGISGGFASIFGTPITGIIIAFELQHFKDMKRIDLILCSTLSSICGYSIFYFFSPHHEMIKFPLDFHFNILFYILVAGVMSGIGGQIFYWGLRGYGKIMTHLFSDLKHKLFIGGFFISLLVYFTQGYSYIGIGTDMIAQSFQAEMGLYDFFMKCLITIMTISIGFKGGEVTPLLFMGATFSNSASSLFGLSQFGISSSLGMVSLFGAVTATPIASAMMGTELFGPEIGVLCFFSCGIARMLMFGKSVYRL